MTEAAQRYAERMVAQRFFADEPPGGETVAARLRAAGYIPGGDVGYLIGENLAWGTYTAATPAETVAAWLASPPHRANILDPRFRETGVGVAAGVPVAAAAGELGATYAQEFGRILR